MNKNKIFLTRIATENSKMKLDIPMTQRFMYDETMIMRCPVNDDTNISFFEGTTAECVRFIVENKISENVYALNFASAENPGGGYENGAKAQEEFNCYLMPELFPSISNAKYPLEPGTVLVTPRIRIMRDGENYELLPHDQIIKLGIVSAAAQNLSRPDTVYDDKLTKRTLSNIFCSTKRCDPLTDTLVLGAWGCGVFKNVPYVIANEFKDVIKKYGGYYKNIVFAIPGGPHDLNVKEFKRVFGFISDNNCDCGSPKRDEFENQSAEKHRRSRKSNRKK